MEQSSARTPPHSMKVHKRGDGVSVFVQLPRSTPPSMINIDADEKGFRLDTGAWGGGYKLNQPWPEQVQGRVKAGKNVEVDAQMQGGNIKVIFEVEPEGGSGKGNLKRRRESVEEGSGAKRKSAESSTPDAKASPSKKQKAPKSKKKGGGPGGAGGAGGEAKEERKKEEKKEKKEKAVGKQLVDAKNDVLKLAESVGGAGEAKTEARLQKEKDRDLKIKQIMAKQQQRKEVKKSRKEELVANAKQAMSKQKEEVEEEAPVKKSKKRISWGPDEIRS